VLNERTNERTNESPKKSWCGRVLDGCLVDDACPTLCQARITSVQRPCTVHRFIGSTVHRCAVSTFIVSPFTRSRVLGVAGSRVHGFTFTGSRMRRLVRPTSQPSPPLAARTELEEEDGWSASVPPPSRNAATVSPHSSRACARGVGYQAMQVDAARKVEAGSHVFSHCRGPLALLCSQSLMGPAVVPGGVRRT
jgi:hypothetical protein